MSLRTLALKAVAHAEWMRSHDWAEFVQEMTTLPDAEQNLCFTLLGHDPALGCRVLQSPDLSRALEDLPRFGLLRSAAGTASLRMEGELAYCSWRPVLEASRGTTELHVSVHCWGGDAQLGVSAAQHIARVPTSVVTIERAGSAGYTLCLGAKRLRIVQSGLILLHSPFAFVGGRPGVLRERANSLQVTIDKTLDLFERRGIKRDRVLAWWNAGDCVFNSAQSLAAGLVDEIVPDEPVEPTAAATEQPASRASEMEVFLTRMFTRAQSIDPVAFNRALEAFRGSAELWNEVPVVCSTEPAVCRAGPAGSKEASSQLHS